MFDPLTQKPNLHVSRFRYMWPNFGEISSNNYEECIHVFRVIGSLPAVNVTFDPLITKSNEHIYEPKYTCDQNSLHYILRYDAHNFLGHCLLWPWPLTRNLISISMNLNISMTKIWQNCLHRFLRYGVHKIFRTHRLTDGHRRKH